MERYPSYVEHSGYYNVTPAEHQAMVGDTFAVEYDPALYHQSVPILPPLTWEEFQDASAATYAALEKHGLPPGLSEQEAKSFYRYCVGDSLSDRTLRVELPDVRVLTPELVVGLQQDVLASRPLWRVMIVNSAPETVVMIYPPVVRVGGAPPEANWRAELLTAVRKEVDLREPCEGPRRRQLNYLKKLVREQIGDLAKDSLRVLAVFDNFRGNFDELSVWFLQRRTEWVTILVRKPDGAMAGDSFSVRPDGEFGRDTFDVKAEYWLYEKVIPAASFDGQLVIQLKPKAEHLPGSERVIEIDPQSIITDALLKANE